MIWGAKRDTQVVPALYIETLLRSSLRKGEGADIDSADPLNNTFLQEDQIASVYSTHTEARDSYNAGRLSQLNCLRPKRTTCPTRHGKLLVLNTQ